MTDLTHQFTALIWCEADDDGDDIERRKRFEHVDDAADAALDLMEATEKKGRRPTRYGWTLIEGKRPDLPDRQAWECEV